MDDEDLIDQEDQDQDYREPTLPLGRPQVVAPPMDAPAAARVAAPGATPITPPVASPMAPLTPQDAQNRAFWRKLQYDTQDAPIEEAEQAVTAALKFQAIRGYQQDLANGVPSHEALSKWAPMMFKTPPAGAFRGPTAPKPMDIGGRGYLYDAATQTMKPLTEGRPVARPRDPFAELQYKGILSQIAQVERELDKTVIPSEMTPLQEKRRYLIGQSEAIRKASQQVQPQAGVTPPTGVATPTAPAPASAPAPAAAAGDKIRVKSPAGKIGWIPAAQLDAALAAGYTKFQSWPPK